ncbi:MAG: hypothetical protein AB9Q19_12490 [Candidatus Reddybacter sp.]
MKRRHLALAELCQRAYAEATHITSEVEVLAVNGGEYLYLAVRGTETAIKPNSWRWADIKAAFSNLRDIGRDLRFYPMRTRHGRVHRGFLLSARRWIDTFAAKLPPSAIIICGHSKGAAEASHIAQRLHEKGFTVKELVLFGEPASRSQRSRNHWHSLNIPTTTYINHGDWVRHTPPWGYPSTRRRKLPGKKGHAIGHYIHNVKQQASI